MKIATFGVFDIIHAGHVKFLERCKKISKNAELIVVLARDSTVLKDKGRKPLTPEEQRKYIVESLKPVDKAILGNEGSDRLSIVEEIKPDIIILGHDQGWDEKELEQELKKRMLKVKVFRLKKYGNINSTSIKNKIKFN
ncbi:MAG: FAD synthase [Candidatus Aenigmarchaeota archaeon]|nr:FAD synthase [Candidatus Aenigmarchaeota archaeon]